MLRGPKSVRAALVVAAAGAIGFVPVLVGSPALADPSDGGLTVSNAAATEGSDILFTLRCAAGANNDNSCLTATYTVTAASTGDGDNATGGGVDYTAATPTTVTFSGAGTKTVTVHTIDDQVYEGNETFTLTAHDEDHDDTATGTGTIYDKQQKPSYTLTASPASVTESSTAKTTITATLSARSSLTTTIDLTETAGTATAADYHAPMVTPLVISAGSLTASTTVAIVDDGVKDSADTETFAVNGVADNASPSSQSATVSIVDAQSTPKLTLTGDSAASEGDVAHYVVHASTASELPITVKWDAVSVTPATGDDHATPGDDFQYPSDRTVTIPAGQNHATIDLPLTADAINENTEDFAVALSSPTNAVLGTTTQVPTKIMDEDADFAPTVSISPASVTEGDAGKVAKTFTATLSQKSGRTVKVNWSTVDSDATGGQDFVSKSGTLTFAPGTLTQTFTVDIIGDTTYEGDESFTIALTNPVGDTSADASDSPTATITITDDDPKPTVSFGDATVKEGDAGNALLLPIKLSNPSARSVVFAISDSTTHNGGTADSGPVGLPGTGDYKLLNDTVTIPAGMTTGYAVVLVNGDTVFEKDETAFIQADLDSNNTHDIDSTDQTWTSKITLTNDDVAPVLKIDNVTGSEGDTVNITGTVTGQADADVPLAISYVGASVNGSKAADNTDFTNPGVTTTTIPLGTASGSILTLGSLALTDDTTTEPAETISVSGIAVGDLATVTPGTVTIAASDGATTPPAGPPTIWVTPWINGAGTVMVSGRATAGATVDIWGGPWTSAMPALTKLGSVTASSTGAYSYSKAITSGYRFKVAVGDKASAEVKAGITEVPVLTATSTTKGMVSLSVSGNPAAPSRGVVVQRWTGKAWVTGWTGPTGTNGVWKAMVKEPSKSVWTLRAYIAGNGSMGVQPGYSAAKKVTVK